MKKYLGTITNVSFAVGSLVALVVGSGMLCIALFGCWMVTLPLIGSDND